MPIQSRNIQGERRDTEKDRDMKVFIFFLWFFNTRFLNIKIFNKSYLVKGYGTTQCELESLISIINLKMNAPWIYIGNLEDWRNMEASSELKLPFPPKTLVYVTLMKTTGHTVYDITHSLCLTLTSVSITYVNHLTFGTSISLSTTDSFRRLNLSSFLLWSFQ